MSNVKLKVNNAKFAVLLIVFSLAFSGIVIVNIGFNLRVIHLLIPLLLILTALSKFNWIISAISIVKNTSVFYLFLMFIASAFYSTYNVAQELGSGIRLWVAMVFNAFLGLIFFGVLSKKSVSFNFLQNLAYYSVFLVSLVIPIQLLLSVVGLYEPHMYGENGFFLLGRPAAFFGDPGWLAYWLVFFSAFVFFMRRTKSVSKKDFYILLVSVVVALLISQSRVSIALIMINYYLIVLYRRPTRRILLIMASVLSLVVVFLIIYFGFIEVPKNLYYDIVKLKANPRFYDTITIYDEFIKSNHIYFGNGLGSLDRLIEFYPWRNYSNSHNIIILQILNDTGVFGVLCFVLSIILLYKKLNNRITKIIFVEFVILLNFHNIFPYFQLFWFLLAFIFVLDKKLNRITEDDIRYY